MVVPNDPAPQPTLSAGRRGTGPRRVRDPAGDAARRPRRGRRLADEDAPRHAAGARCARARFLLPAFASLPLIPAGREERVPPSGAGCDQLHGLPGRPRLDEAPEGDAGRAPDPRSRDADHLGIELTGGHVHPLRGQPLHPLHLRRRLRPRRPDLVEWDLDRLLAADARPDSAAVASSSQYRPSSTTASTVARTRRSPFPGARTRYSAHAPGLGSMLPSAARRPGSAKSGETGHGGGVRWAATARTRASSTART